MMDGAVYRRCREVIEKEADRQWTWHILNDRLFEMLDTPPSTEGMPNNKKRSNWTRTELRSFFIHGPFEKLHVIDRYTAAVGFRRSRKRVVYVWKQYWEDAQEEE